MAIITKIIKINTKGNGDMIDVTQDVEGFLADAGLKSGIVTVFVPGSTASVTTIEFEPGLVHDFPAAMERFAPAGIKYGHDMTWGDGNGYSHVRASVIGPGIVVPFNNKRIMLGKWQQVVIIDFDNRPRSREVIFQAMGE
jgi:secondary thiamine-phosphate synthase enzyme